MVAAKNPTQYKMNWISKFTGRRNSEDKLVADYRGVLVCTGYRRVYQDMKVQYKRRAS